MQIRSSGSVRIISLDPSTIMKKLRTAAEELKKRDNNVVEIFLFGSLAKGEAVPGSDADVLIVLKKSEKRIIDRVTDFMDSFSNLNIGVDIFPYTLEEIEEFKEEGNSLIKEMLGNKIALA
jgi:predicted nucleotidyltransferase